MSIVVDTTILIDHLRGVAEAFTYIDGLTSRPHCSEISRVEVVRGLRSEERVRARRLFTLLDWVPLTAPLAERAGELGRRWRRSHAGIDTADLIVAATAEALDLNVATTNVRHFPMFPGLRRPYRAGP